MEKAQTRVQDAVTEMSKTLDKEYFRKMQVKMYNCSAACCENEKYTMQDVQSCLERCSVPVTGAQNYLQQELSSFQDRLQRCAVDCQDQIRDKVGPNPTEADVLKYRGQMETCVIKCADTHVALIPTIMKRMREVLKKNQ